MQILNVGCGKDIKRGVDEWTNLDKHDLPGVDVVHDINNPLPFKDNNFDMVFASHIVEHLEPKKRIYILHEFWRITKPGGKIEIMCPTWDHRNAYIDPTHLSVWQINTVDYFVPGHWANYYSDMRWKIEVSEIRGDEAAEIHWVLKVIK